jgi:hypothetical protein
VQRPPLTRIDALSVQRPAEHVERVFHCHVYWRKTRKSRWVPAFKTRTARLRRAIQSVADWCRRYRHLPVKEQHAALTRKLVGHYNYFGVNANLRSLTLLLWQARRAWRAWLDRRS